MPRLPFLRPPWRFPICESIRHMTHPHSALLFSARQERSAATELELQEEQLQDDASVDLEITSLSPREQALGERFRHAATLVARGEKIGVRTRTTLLALTCFVAGAAVSALALRGGEAEEDDGWEAPAAEDESVAGREEAERDEGVFRWTLVLGILAVSATIAARGSSGRSEQRSFDSASGSIGTTRSGR